MGRLKMNNLMDMELYYLKNKYFKVIFKMDYFLVQEE